VSDACERTIGTHADRPVLLVEHDGDAAVLKRYERGGAALVHGQMVDLWASGFRASMPRPIALVEQGRSVLMSRCDGTPLGSRGDVGDAPRRAREVAELLAALHSCGVVVDRRRGPAELLRSSGRKAAELADIAADVGTRRTAALAGELVAALSAALPPVTGLVVSHGDFSPRNVLATPARLMLIDFDRLQMADPARDLSYWASWIWVTQYQRGATPSWSPGEDVVAHYAAERPDITTTPRSTWAFYRAVSLLRIAHGWSALRADPTMAAGVLGAALGLLEGDRRAS